MSLLKTMSWTYEIFLNQIYLKYSKSLQYLYLREETLLKHTYDVRAYEFVNLLKRYFDVEFIKISNKHVDVDYSSVVAPSLKEKLSPNDDAITDKDDSNGRDNDSQISSMRKVNLFSDQPPSTCDFSSVPKSICVGVRTMPSHKDWIGTMISGLSNQYRASILNQNQFNSYRRKAMRNNGLNSVSASEVSLGLQIYIANTEIPDTDYLLFLRDLVHQANENMFFKSQVREQLSHFKSVQPATLAICLT